MCKKLILLVSAVLVLDMVLISGAGAADPDLIGWWKLDDGSGNTAADLSGSSNDGTINNAASGGLGDGGSAWFIDPERGMVLSFNGNDSGGAYVSTDLLLPAMTLENDFTWAFWAKQDSAQAANNDTMLGNRYGASTWIKFTPSYFEFGGHSAEYSIDYDNLPGDTWAHHAVVKDGMDYTYYRDGVQSGTNNINRTCEELPFFMGGDAVNVAELWQGCLSDVRLYTKALSAAEVLAAMEGAGGLWPYASKPTPADGALYTDTWVSMSWKPGGYAVSHDVYMGENFDDVNDGTGDTFRGSQGKDAVYFVAGFTGYAYPDGLVPGTTYYWRIDEVNDADPNSPWKGDVWSFTVPSKKAYEPNPADGLEFIATDVTLSWTGGLDSILHNVFFGESFEEVDAATEGIPSPFTSYTPIGLELGKTYYWRVDETDITKIHKGDVWSFKTLPDIPISDPDLIGWWKLDEGAGLTAVDWSGYGNHGAISNADSGGLGDGRSAWFNDPDLDKVLSFNGNDIGGAYVSTDLLLPAMTLDNDFTWAFWAKQDSAQATNNDTMLGNRYGASTWIKFTPSFFEFGSNAAEYAIDYDNLPGDTWVHHAVVKDGMDYTYYRNGVQSGTNNINRTCEELPFFMGGDATNVAELWRGCLSDVRLYTKALTVEELQKAMRGDPLLAGLPNPANGSTLFIRDALPLTWSAGENASQHDVYYGTDRDAVDDADTSTADIYRGRQAGTSYSPLEGVEWGGGPYYWRIDEFNNDGTISRGRIWSFAVADFILIDDFEDYDAGDNQIWYSWIDGLGYGAPGTALYNPGNGTGAAVGDETSPSYTEETIVHGGSKSMPLAFDNNKQGFAKYSETELTLTAPRDWTQEGVANLSLWFRGYPASTGSFVEGPVGTFTMTGSGADIWNVGPGAGEYHDEFHFAYKMLTGQGSIVARVESIDNTNVWAKAGVMIRSTLDGGSVHAMMIVSAASGVSFQRRPETGAASASDTTAGITAPYWVKLERDLAGNFTAYSSDNGSTWQMVGVAEPIQMGTNVYIGLAVTAHNASATCQAIFTNVTTTGSVGPLWANQDIGIESNDAEPLYVAVSNSAGAPAVVVHDDPAAATIDTWTQWVIPLQAFADQGISLTKIDRIAIGLGSKGNMTIPGGAGKMYFDDIRLYQPREVAE